MSAELDELEELLLAQCTDDKPRRHAQKLLKKLRKSLQRAEFKYDRLLREKAIQSKLLTQTSAELEEAVARAQQATREAEAQRARAEAAAVEIQLERERSERLLYSVLPRPIAEISIEGRPMQRFDLRHGPLVFGRHESCQVVLASSRRLAFIVGLSGVCRGRPRVFVVVTGSRIGDTQLTEIGPQGNR